MSKRLITQIIAAILANPFWSNFARADIYQGSLKGICVPVLNCYSCPAAVGSCPLGIIQNSLAAPAIRFPFYVFGFLVLAGAIAGRWFCGWLCPFGLIQDLLGKLTRIKVKMPRLFAWGKYVVLGLLILLPIVWVNSSGVASPYFCQYLCPKGTLSAGIPLVAGDPASFAPMVGTLFWVKIAILGVILTGAIFIHRPFCQTLCPLGAFFGFFNKFSLFRLHYDQDKCNNCRKCSKNCPLDLELPHEHNSRECIRCLQCRDACQPGALSWGAKITDLPGHFSREAEVGKNN